ncbi:hypothetical protein FIBSPDRAFT_308331 [Athelia psychrophila]|uniref:Uncharacterized protein n=1 Tax=Athelia psychrophila TaxID=1759441 RepID=A0A166W8D4_9AGAM|nr:hypothetical protein FIBSPDRAFT_308331 [Fibularhizoctonia sp. CBS 109695]
MFWKPDLWPRFVRENFLLTGGRCPPPIFMHSLLVILLSLRSVTRALVSLWRISPIILTCFLALGACPEKFLYSSSGKALRLRR